MSPDSNNPILIKQHLEEGGLPSGAAAGFLDGFLENPQNWNRYTYVRNNPLEFVDPNGNQAGHHLIVERKQYTSAIARNFTEAIKTGPLSGSGYPNQPGFTVQHAAYNDAVEEIIETAERTAGNRNTWGVAQWKSVATEILNSSEPRIKDFLDELEANNPGARAALAAAISSYRLTASFIARTIASLIVTDALTFFRTAIFYVDLGPNSEEKPAAQHRRCLVDRKTGQCIVD